MTWTLTWRDRSWTSADLTGHHAAVVAELLGIDPSWEWFDLSELHPARGPLHVMALIAACICVADDVRGTAARTAVLNAIKGATIDELTAAVAIP